MKKKPQPSSRSAIEPFIVMEVMRAAADREHAGDRVIHMEVGQPGAVAPPAVLDAARAALADGVLGYTEALGHRKLRTRISQYYAEMHGIEVPMERVVIATGSSAAFNMAFLAGFDVGDRIALTAPGYPAYRNLASAVGMETVEIPVDAASGYTLTPAMLEKAHREKPLAGLLVASPANPTGTIMAPAALKALIEAAEDMGIVFISDEIYHRLVYAGTAATALDFSNDAIVINSFSKYYCMTGWRVGWMVVPDPLLRPIERIAQNLAICAPTISQRAAIAAFEATPDFDVIRDGYAANRRLLLDRLPKIGFEDLFPVDGAFYVYASVRRFANDSLAFTSRMLAEAGVAATPGHDFDRINGNGFIRFSFAGTEAAMGEAMDRLSHWLR
ncbi:MAG TPA: aminotransferase class I/II-fold pyridoxal phosphate-dependent enzyme [Bauldia sp.]|nr:aminotransferase class I/II-fold pyridoxal phosphate-dependent enzyme [Bauldia sp.]